MAEGDSTDDFLTTLKTLPKVLPIATKSAEGTQDSWCGSDLPHDEGDGMYLALFVSSLSPVSASDDELVVNTGPDSSSPPKNSLSSPSSLGNSVKGKNPLKRKASEASVVQNGDPDRPPAAGACKQYSVHAHADRSIFYCCRRTARALHCSQEKGVERERSCAYHSDSAHSFCFCYTRIQCRSFFLSLGG